jgi:hypothetical protein
MMFLSSTVVLPESFSFWRYGTLLIGVAGALLRYTPAADCDGLDQFSSIEGRKLAAREVRGGGFVLGTASFEAVSASEWPIQMQKRRAD